MYQNINRLRAWVTVTPLRTSIAFYIALMPSYCIARALADTRDFFADVWGEILFGLVAGLIFAPVIFLLAARKHRKKQKEE